VIQLCSNDYLGLAADPRLRRAAAAAAGRWGAGTGASRLVSGTTGLHRSLEASLARLKGCEDAIVFSSGYLANVGTIPALAGKQDAVFSDELNHASIIDGCRLSGARVVVYRHADAADLERALTSVDARRRLVVTDTVFSMQGDLAPVPDIARLRERHGAMLMVDDAHATGLLEDASSGAGIVMSTLSKALGSAGGFVAALGLGVWARHRTGHAKGGQRDGEGGASKQRGGRESHISSALRPVSYYRLQESGRANNPLLGDTFDR